MHGIEIYIDESGDFGPFDEHCPYYIVTMVFHETNVNLFENIQDLEYRLSLLGLAEHCIHSGPVIRGEDEFRSMDIVSRRKALAYFAAFFRKSGLKYKCFFIRKKSGMADSDVAEALSAEFNPFITANFERLLSYSLITVAYDKGQRQLSQLLTKTFEKNFENVRIVKILPVQSRLFQAADLICTMKRISFRLKSLGSLSKCESLFFGNSRRFNENWLKPILKREWK